LSTVICAEMGESPHKLACGLMNRANCQCLYSITQQTELSFNYFVSRSSL